MADQTWEEFIDKSRRNQKYLRKAFEYKGKRFFAMISIHEPDNHRILFVHEDGRLMQFCHVEACFRSFNSIPVAKRMATSMARGRLKDFESRIAMDMAKA